MPPAISWRGHKNTTDYKLHVWFIYTHTKCSGSYHNLQQKILRITNCTSGLSIPIPNAVVATTTCNKNTTDYKPAVWFIYPITNTVVATTTCNKHTPAMLMILEKDFL
jgi:hypothetical protein